MSVMLTEKQIRKLIKNKIISERSVFGYQGPSRYSGSGALRVQSCAIAVAGEDGIIRDLNKIEALIKKTFPKFKNAPGTIKTKDGNTPSIDIKDVPEIGMDGERVKKPGSETEFSTINTVVWNITAKTTRGSDESIYLFADDHESLQGAVNVYSKANDASVKGTHWAKDKKIYNKLKMLYKRIAANEKACSADSRRATRAGEYTGGDGVAGTGGFLSGGTGLYTYQKDGKDHRGFRITINKISKGAIAKLKKWITTEKLIIKYKNNTVYILIPDPAVSGSIRATGVDFSALPTRGSQDMLSGKWISNSRAAIEISNKAGSLSANSAAVIRALISIYKDNAVDYPPGVANFTI